MMDPRRHQDVCWVQSWLTAMEAGWITWATFRGKRRLLVLITGKGCCCHLMVEITRSDVRYLYCYHCYYYYFRCVDGSCGWFGCKIPVLQNAAFAAGLRGIPAVIVSPAQPDRANTARFLYLIFFKTIWWFRFGFLADEAIPGVLISDRRLQWDDTNITRAVGDHHRHSRYAHLNAALIILSRRWFECPCFCPLMEKSWLWEPRRLTIGGAVRHIQRVWLIVEFSKVGFKCRNWCKSVATRGQNHSICAGKPHTESVCCDRMSVFEMWDVLSDLAAPVAMLQPSAQRSKCPRTTAQ